MDWISFFTGAGSTGLLVILLTAFVNHSLTKGREAEARASALRQKQRDESRAVADILAEWTRSTYLGTFSNEDRWKLQVTYWRNILGLDKRLIELLFPLLANDRASPGSNEMIVQVRRILLGLNEPDIEARDLNNWAPLLTEHAMDPKVKSERKAD